MSFINLQVELSQTNLLLTRIAEALERAMPIPRVPRESKLRGPESIIQYSDEGAWEEEQIANLTPEGLTEDEAKEFQKDIEDLPADLRELIRQSVTK